MSDSIPKPLSSIVALRAHIKLLERGVNTAREARVGPATPAPAPVMARPTAPARTTPAPSTAFQIAQRPATSATGTDGKPKAKAKSGIDFGDFFGNAAKRAAG